MCRRMGEKRVAKYRTALAGSWKGCQRYRIVITTVPFRTVKWVIGELGIGSKTERYVFELELGYRGRVIIAHECYLCS